MICTHNCKQLSPSVRFFAGRSQSFVQCGTEWHRLTSEDEARLATGFARESREPNVGVYVARRPNGLVRLGFDLARLDLKLTPAAIERLEGRWRGEASNFSKPLYRATLRRTHFSRSFTQFEVAPERVEGWKLELESVLSDPNTYESI